jgi:hypothetical protein
MPSFRYPSSVLHELVKLPKSVVGGKLVFHEVREGRSAAKRDISDKRQGPSKEARVTLEAKGGRAALLELVVNAGRLDDVTTYHASLLVDQVRIRGVDFNEIERARHYKTRIPKGWHENVIDPNTGENRHEPINFGTVIDLDNFCRKVAELWHISYEREEKLL